MTTSATLQGAELRPVIFEDITTSKRPMATGFTAKDVAAARARPSPTQPSRASTAAQGRCVHGATRLSTILSTSSYIAVTTSSAALDGVKRGAAELALLHVVAAAEPAKSCRRSTGRRRLGPVVRLRGRGTMRAYDFGVLGHAAVVLRREVLIVALELAKGELLRGGGDVEGSKAGHAMARWVLAKRLAMSRLVGLMTLCSAGTTACVLTFRSISASAGVVLAMTSHDGVWSLPRMECFVVIDVSGRVRARRMLAARTCRIGRPRDSTFVVVAHASIEVLCTGTIVDVEVPDLAGARWMKTGRPYGSDSIPG